MFRLPGCLARRVDLRKSAQKMKTAIRNSRFDAPICSRWTSLPDTEEWDRGFPSPTRIGNLSKPHRCSTNGGLDLTERLTCTKENGEWGMHGTRPCASESTLAGAIQFRRGKKKKKKPKRTVPAHCALHIAYFARTSCEVATAPFEQTPPTPLPLQACPETQV